VSKVEIGAGFLAAAIAAFISPGSDLLNIVLLTVGVVLLLLGGYDVYFKPNFWLDNTLKRWLKRRHWKIIDENFPKDTFYFGFWIEEAEHQRKIFVSRSKVDKGILAFSAQLSLDAPTLASIANLSPTENRRLHEELQILLASMLLGYIAADFAKAGIQHGLPIDDSLTEHEVDLKAKQISLSVAAARSLIRKTVL